MKRNLEVTFDDGSKSLHLAETWDEMNIRSDGFMELKFMGDVFCLHNLSKVKSIIMMEDVEE